MNFLERSAEFIFTHFGEQISDLCIVLPNKRASLFLKNHISSFYEKPFFAPDFMTIRELAQELSGLRIIENINLIFLLFSIHQEIEKEKAQSFDKFMKWGPVLISDFNDIDQYLVDAQNIYGYLSESKAIEKWNLGREELSEFELNYLRFYNSLFDYYEKFKNILLNEKKAYQGLALRKAQKNAQHNKWLDQYQKVLFIGFNALSKSEENIIESLIESGKADTLWDADEYYMSDKTQEAGAFLREIKKKRGFGEFKWIERNFKDSEKKLDIIGVPKMAGQVKVAGELLSQSREANAGPGNMAVVLAEESLLLPLLNSIPAHVGPFNVTMGLGLTNTPLYSLLDAVLILHENARRIRASGKHYMGAFFTRDLINILKHPYSRVLEQISEGPVELGSVVDELNMSNQVFMRLNKFMEITQAGKTQFAARYFHSILDPWESASDAISQMNELLLCLRDIFIVRKEESGLDHKTEFEYLYELSRLITGLKNILESFPADLETKTLRKVIKSLVQMASIPFYGEPLEGVQIMGMLESRALDFEKLMLLSVNEGLIPKGREYNSFIPFDIRREFQLPTFREKDAIFAYHFYRLIQRAKHITLIYNTEADDLGGGDRSRFITQLLYELPSYNPDIKIQEQILGGVVQGHLPQPIEIPKGPDIMEKLLEKAKGGFSPSALNLFIRCPLKFYFTEIMELGEPEEIDEGVDAATLGNVVHLALKNLLQPYRNKDLRKETVKIQDDNIEKNVDQAFRKYFSGGETGFGKNYLITRVAVQWIRRLLKPEQFNLIGDKCQTWKIRDLEKQFSGQIELNSKAGKKLNIRLKGTIDRIDELDGNFLVIDYKTGSVNPSTLNISNREGLTQDAKYAQAMQLMIYSYLYLRGQKDQAITGKAGILSVPKSSQGMNYLKNGRQALLIDHNMVMEFEQQIITVLQKIFDPELPFKQTAELDNCKYCPFTGTCERQA
jgi:hypothetical protein